MVHPGEGTKEWVEIYVPEGKDCTGYWIDDDTDFDSDTGNGKKYHIEQYLHDSLSRYYIVELPIALFNNTEDNIILFDAQGNVVDQYIYTSDPGIDISIGRNPDSSGIFYTLLFVTKGRPNSLPIPTQTPIPSPTIKPTKEPTIEPTQKIPTPMPTSIPFIEESTFHISPIQQVKGASITTKQPAKSNIATSGAYPTVILLPEETIAPTYTRPSPTGIVMVKSASKIGPFYTILGGLSLTSCAILMVIKR